MKQKLLLMLLSLVLTLGISSCSNDDPDPDKYVTSLLSGDYKKNGLWTLSVTENGTPVEDYGYVRFTSKDLKEGDFKFVDVIPHTSSKEFKNVPLNATEDGVTFTITDDAISISGTISFGKMTVNLTL